jgi:uncharacterized DUF497 family protein
VIAVNSPNSDLNAASARRHLDTSIGSYEADLVNFEWDPRKAASNLRKHRVSFEEAATAFGDPLSITIGDPDHSEDEQRFLLLGMSHAGRLLVVAHAERAETSQDHQC